VKGHIWEKLDRKGLELRQGRMSYSSLGGLNYSISKKVKINPSRFTETLSFSYQKDAQDRMKNRKYDYPQ